MSKTEAALLDAIAQARAQHDVEIALTLAMQLEAFRRLRGG